MTAHGNLGKLLIVGVALIVGATGCNGASAPQRVLVPSSADVAALAVTAGGGLYYGDRLTGDIFFLPSGGTPTSTPVAHVDVSANEGQRGLLGLAVDAQGRLFAGYTAAGDEERVTVAQVSPAPIRVVWDGPPSADLANGGHIALAPNGTLTIGIGDLTDRSKLDDPTAPNGKLLSLEPAGAPSQVPAVISSNWNNPYAFTYRPDGSLYVGDNEPGNGSERLARADQNGTATDVTHIGPHQVASGLAAERDGSLWECTFLGRTLQRYTVGASGVPHKAGAAAAKNCSLGAVAFPDGNIAYSTGSEIRVLDVTK